MHLADIAQMRGASILTDSSAKDAGLYLKFFLRVQFRLASLPLSQEHDETWH
jgi:hypothetical protein